MIVSEEILQEEKQPGPSRQCKKLAQSSNDESSDEEDDGTTCKVCQIPLDRTDGEMQRLGSMRHM